MSQQNKPVSDASPRSLAQWLLRMLQGALIGVGAILPGISGGVLMVVFGIYKPIMAMFSHPFRSFRKYYQLFIPVLLGWGLGFVVLAKGVELLFGADSAVATCLFLGLILGTVPSLWREAGAQGRSRGHVSTLGVSFAIVLALLSLFKFSSLSAITPNPWWYLFCGGVWGLSLVLPGLSSSSILIFMGLYEPMTAGIGSIATYLKDFIAAPVTGQPLPALSQVQWGCILPLMVGILASALLFARLVNYLIENHHAVIHHIILGVVLASTLLIIPTAYTGLWQVLLCIICAVVGFFAALGLDKWGSGIRKE